MAVALIVVGTLAMNVRALLAWALPPALGLALHGNAHIAQVDIGGGRMILRGVHVTKNDAPLLDAQRIEVDYSLRDLLPGSAHRFGLLAVDVDRPVLTFRRNADGSYNLALGGGGAPSGPPAGPQRRSGVPLAFTLVVHDAAIALRAPHALDPQARAIDVTNLQVRATVDTATRTHYRLSAIFAHAPLRAGGTVDAVRGFAMHRVQIPALTIRPIANFFINSKASKVLAGTARGIDVRMYALGVEPEAPVDYHLSGRAAVDDARMLLVGLAQPVEHLHGTLQLVDDQLFFNDLRAQVAGIAMTGVGSIFKFPGDPQFRLGISGRGDLAGLRTLFAFAKNQPLAGPARIGVAVDGGLEDPGPRVQATVDAPHASYRGIVFDNLRARVAYSNSTVFFMPLEAHAQGSTFTIRGALEVGDNVVSRVGLHIDAPADALPYAGALLGAEPLTGDFMLHGKDLNFYGYGALQSARDRSRMAAVVHADPGGILDVAPLWIATRRGTLYAGYRLDRSHDSSSFWISAHHLAVHTPAHTSFLATALPVMPPLDGIVDDVAILGGGPSGQRALVAGRVHLHATTIAGVRLDRVQATFAGTLADAALDPIDARGPWGSLHGTGALSLNTMAVHGHYTGTLQGLRQFLSGTPASGAIDGTAALALGPQGIIVQADDLHLHNATIHGLPISRATGTLAIRNGALNVESARASVASGAVVAAGSFDRGIALVATHLQAPQLRALGLPLDAGTVDADGTLAQGAPLPTFNGGVAVANGRVQHFAVAGSSLVALHGDSVDLSHTVGGMDNVYAIASGNLHALTSGEPAYDLQANVPAGDLRTVVNELGITLHYTEGTFNADVALRGAGLQPEVNGPIGLPAGSVNGLYFTDASGVIDANTSGVAVEGGAVSVASTRLAFDAVENPEISALQVHTSYANLSDFDNFFDTGDTLSGTGPVRFDVLSEAHRISSNGDINIAHLRYRTLPIGTTVASWSSARNVVYGALDINGAQGTLRSHGSIAVAQEPRLLNVLRDSRYDISAQLGDVDLSTWIAALGAPQVAVTGRVDANATVNGRWPYPHFKGNAELRDGTIWRLPIDDVRAAFSTGGQRVHLDSASFASPGLTAEAYGSMGFSMQQPLQFTLHASSSDLPRLAAELWRRQLPVSGAFESTLTLGGTPADPTVNATFDGTKTVLYGISVPSLHGAVALQRHAAVLRDANISLPKGSISIDGTLPVQINPFALGPPHAPLSFELKFNGVDPSAFDAVLGNNTKLGGAINGDLGITGTVVAPQINGRFTVAKGTYVSDLSRTPITGIEADFSFNRTSATVQKLQGNFGSGTISGTGNIAFGDNPTYLVMATARNAQLNLPAYGTGTLNGAIAVTRTAGQTALLSGKIELSNAAIPFSAFLAATQTSAQTVKLPPLDLDVDMVVGKNVRVRGSGFGAGLDIAGSGEAQLAGTLAAPTMAGTFSASNGTLTYYDRAFRVQTAKVIFRPENGVIPNIRATATTRVNNPDPNSPYSGVDVSVEVVGQVTNPRITFSSNPPGYSNEQILAMIAPFGGVILSGLSYAPSLNGYGTVPGQPVGATGTFSAGQEAFNILNAQFAAGLLAPVEGALSQGLGVQNVNLTLDYFGNVGFSASRLLGKTVNFIYAATFGIPQRTSFGLQLLGEKATSAQLVFFYENGPQKVFQIPAAGSIPTGRISAGQPLQGQQGFAFTFQRLFW